MRSNALNDAVVIIGQDDVSLRIEFEDEVVCERLGSESEDDHSFDSYLSN